MYILDGNEFAASEGFKFPPMGEKEGIYFYFKSFLRRVHFQLKLPIRGNGNWHS